MDQSLFYRIVPPGQSLAGLVESFWCLENRSDQDKEVVVLPDGRIDLFFSRSADAPFYITLLGIETAPGKAMIAPRRKTFAISFKPLAAEYIFHQPLKTLLNKAQNLPAGFWGFTTDDLDDFDTFCSKATQKIHALLPATIDNRKTELFQLLYASGGALTVKALSEQVFWSSRQINRYFMEQYGLTLKAYCNILRFRSSFQHIKEGKLFPEQNFADQSHFIREVKKLSGVSPKELSKNQNDRFIQFSTLDQG